MRAAAQWLAVAAGLLVAFTIGSWHRERGMPITNNPAATNQQLVTVPPPTAAPNNAKANDALNLWVRDDGGQLRRVRVPLVDAQRLIDSLARCFKPACPMMCAIG